MRFAICPMRYSVTVIVRSVTAFIFATVLCFLSAGCEGKREQLIQGRTMGTTYHIKIVTGYFQSVSGLKEKIEKRLVDINAAMSTYQKESEISRFNSFKPINQGFKISNDFYQVMKTAQKIFKLSGGAWDGTVNPLVDLWGFGRTGRKSALPPKQAIADLMPTIGFENIQILETGVVVKKRSTVTLDLSSIAKGYGVDQVADVIRKEGFQHYLVEIGGEVFASGYRKDGKLWRIGLMGHSSRPENVVTLLGALDRTLS